MQESCHARERVFRMPALKAKAAAHPLPVAIFSVVNKLDLSKALSCAAGLRPAKAAFLVFKACAHAAAVRQRERPFGCLMGVLTAILANAAHSPQKPHGKKGSWPMRPRIPESRTALAAARAPLQCRAAVLGRPSEKLDLESFRGCCLLTCSCRPSGRAHRAARRPRG